MLNSAADFWSASSHDPKTNHMTTIVQYWPPSPWLALDLHVAPDDLAPRPVCRDSTHTVAQGRHGFEGSRPRQIPGRRPVRGVVKEACTKSTIPGHRIFATISIRKHAQENTSVDRRCMRGGSLTNAHWARRCEKTHTHTHCACVCACACVCVCMCACACACAPRHAVVAATACVRVHACMPACLPALGGWVGVVGVAVNQGDEHGIVQFLSRRKHRNPHRHATPGLLVMASVGQGPTLDRDLQLRPTHPQSVSTELYRKWKVRQCDTMRTEDSSCQTRNTIRILNSLGAKMCRCTEMLPECHYTRMQHQASCSCLCTKKRASTGPLDCGKF